MFRSAIQYPRVRHNTLGVIAKLDQKGDIYTNIFNQIDKDHNGTLDKDEFHDATKALNLSLNTKELSQIYESISENNVITLQSFRCFIQKSVRIHKQFMKFRKLFTSAIIRKTVQSKINETNLLIEEPIYKSTFTHIKLTQLHKIDIALPLLSDANDTECFIGYSHIITHNNNGCIQSQEDTSDTLDAQTIEKERNNILNLIAHSQIIKINNIYCEGLQHHSIISLLHSTVLPHTIVFRKTMGIAVNKDDDEYDDDGDDDVSGISSCAQSASMHDSDKYVVHHSPSPNMSKTTVVHCKYCPHKCSHPWLLAMHRTFEDETYSKLSFAIITYIMICIIVSTVAYVVETLPSVQRNASLLEIFMYIEIIVSVSFTIEYVIRIIACRNRGAYFLDTMNLIDFLAVIPFWIELLSGKAGANILRVIRVVRLARVIRLMKSDRFIEYLNVFIATIKRSSESFGLLSTLIVLQVILFGSLFYVIEAGSNDMFSSIPMGAFYTVVTITTVGYGDMIPQTVLGRIVAIFCMFFGLLIVALPVIIIGGNFENEYRAYIANKERKLICAKAKQLDDANYSMNPSDIGFCEVYRFLKKINAKFEAEIFVPQDAHIMVKEGLCNEQRLLELLYNERGYAFYPSSIKKSKIFVLHELYGQKKRDAIAINADA